MSYPRNDFSSKRKPHPEERDQVFQLQDQLNSNIKAGPQGGNAANQNLSNMDKMSANNFSTTTKSKFNTIDQYN